MATYRIDLAYEGTGFHGYAAQPGGVRTVQGCLDEAIAKSIGRVATTVAGRTDRGVHARGQVVSFVAADLDTGRLLRSLNRQLGPEITTLAVVEVEDGFDARFSATERAYVYRVLDRAAPDPFISRTAWHVGAPLDVAAMEEAGRTFVGEHDFASFCRAAEGRTTVRTVTSATWLRGPLLVEFHIAAVAFCHQMVRSLVAVCVDVGRGRMASSEALTILNATDRRRGRGVAPPHGLTLLAVAYAGEPLPPAAPTMW